VLATTTYLPTRSSCAACCCTRAAWGTSNPSTLAVRAVLSPADLRTQVLRRCCMGYCLLLTTTHYLLGATWVRPTRQPSRGSGQPPLPARSARTTRPPPSPHSLPTTYRLTDLPTYRLTDLPTYRLTDLPTYRLTDLPTYRLTDLLFTIYSGAHHTPSVIDPMIRGVMQVRIHTRPCTA
jgi:hypothetical protein